MDADRIRELLARHPELKERPGVAVPLATAGVSNQQQDQVAGLDAAQQWIQYLRTAPSAQARSAYGNLNQAHRDALRAAGYNGPLAEGQKKSWFKRAWGGIDDVVVGAVKGIGVAGEAVGNTYKDLVGSTLAPIDRGLDSEKFLGGAVGDLKDQYGELGKSVVVDPAVYALGGLYEDTTQYIRANLYAAQQDGSGIFDTVTGLLGAAPTLGMSNAIRFWSEVEDGNKVFNRDAILEIEANSDPTMYALARWQAEGERDEDGSLVKHKELFQQLMAEGRVEDATAMGAMLESDEYKDLVDKINDTKLSYDREFARALGIPEGSDAFNIVSGTVAAAGRIALDPLTYIPGGQIAAAKYGFKAAQLADPAAFKIRIDDIYGYDEAVDGLVLGGVRSFLDDSGRLIQEATEESGLYAVRAKPLTAGQKEVRRAGDEVGDLLAKVRAANSGAPDAAKVAKEAMDTLREKYPKWVGAGQLDDLIKSNVDDWKSLRDYFITSSGQVSLVSGQTAHRIKVVPYRTAVAKWAEGTPVSKPQSWSKKGREHAALVASVTDEVYRNNGIIQDMGPNELDALYKMVKNDAKFLRTRAHARQISRRAKTRLPNVDPETGRFNVTGPDAVANFERFAAMFVPDEMVRIMSPLYATADTSLRLNLIRGVQSTALEAYGLRNSAQGAEMANKMMRNWDDIAKGGTTVYGRDGARTTAYTLKEAQTGLGDEAAVYAHQMTESVSMINFPEFMQVMGKAQHANWVNTKLFNHAMVDWITQRVWRPLILLRPALAFRNANEELFNSFVRNGMLGEAGFFSQYSAKVFGQQSSREAREREIHVAEQELVALRRQVARDFVKIEEKKIMPTGPHLSPAPTKPTEEILSNPELYDEWSQAYRAKIKAAEVEALANSRRVNKVADKKLAEAKAARRKADKLARGLQDKRSFDEWYTAEQARLAKARAKGKDPKGKTPPAAVLDRAAVTAEVRALREEANKLTQSGALIRKKIVDVTTQTRQSIDFYKLQIDDLDDKVVSAFLKKETAEALPKGVDQDAGRMMRGVLSVVSPFRAVAAAAAGRMSPKAGAAINQALDHTRWASGVDVFTAKVLSKMGESYLSRVDPEAIDILRRVSMTTHGAKLMQEEVYAATRRSLRHDIDSLDNKAGVVRKSSGKWVKIVTFDSPGGLTSAARDEGAQAWAITLQKLMTDPAARAAVRFLDDPARAAAVAKRVHMSDPFYAANARRAAGDQDEWARIKVEDLRAHLSDVNGEFNEGLFRQLFPGRTVRDDRLDAEFLKNVPNEMRPLSVYTSQDSIMIEMPASPLEAFTEKAWATVGNLTAGLSRHHQFWGEYVQAAKTLRAAELQEVAELKRARDMAAMMGPAPTRAWDDLSAAEQAKFQSTLLEYQRMVSATQGEGIVGDARINLKPGDPLFDTLGIDVKALHEARRAEFRQRAAHDKGMMVPALQVREDYMAPFGMAVKYNDHRGKSLSEILDGLHKNDFVFYARSQTDSEIEEMVAKKYVDMSLDLGLQQMLRYVDNPKIRSQAAVLFRNTSPFYRAQEEFVRRWVNVGKYSPKALWRFNMLMEAGSDSGIVYDDPQTGQKRFVIPGSGAAANLMIDVLRNIGMDISTPEGGVQNMTGSLKGLMPGFDIEQNIRPFSGPIVSVPIQSIRGLTGSRSAELLEKGLLSKYGHGQTATNNLLPGWARSFFPNEEVESKAMQRAIASLAAGGVMFPAHGDDVEKQEFMDLARSTARGELMAKALIATTFPAFPKEGDYEQASALGSLLGATSLSEEFQIIAQQYGYENAYYIYKEIFPDRLPFVVGGNTYAAGTSPTVTAAASEFMKENAGVLARYKGAAALVLPVGEGEFDHGAWDMARRLGMFETKDEEQYAMEVASAAQRHEYYSAQKLWTDEIKKLEGLGDKEGVREARANWSAFAKQYRAENPLVESFVTEGGSKRAADRQGRLNDLRRMLNDPDLPETIEVSTLREVVLGYDEMNQARARYSTQSDADNLGRKEASQRFHDWMESLSLENPTASSAYNSIFRYLS
jgi:hypothetical protein